MSVTVEFHCDQCGHRWLDTVEHKVWRLPCKQCGASARRLIQVSFVFPQAQHEVHDFRAANEKTEPKDDIIRAVHRYNYNEEISNSEIASIKKHKPVVW